MADIREKMPRQDILKQFPHLEEWLSTNHTAQTNEARRLLSPEEKIEMQGGVELVGQNIMTAHSNGWGVDYCILSACFQDPMVKFEIVRYAAVATQDQYLIPVISLSRTLSELRRGRLIAEVEDVTSILLNPKSNYQDGYVRRSGGFVTTVEGLARRGNILEGQSNPDTFGKLVPIPG